MAHFIEKQELTIVDLVQMQKQKSTWQVQGPQINETDFQKKKKNVYNLMQGPIM